MITFNFAYSLSTIRQSMPAIIMHPYSIRITISSFNEVNMVIFNR